MNNDEWQQIGEDIRRQVQEAVDAGDFSKLSKTISDTVGLAIDGVNKSLNDVVDGVGKSINEAVGGVGKSLNNAASGMGRGMGGPAGEAGTGFAVSGQGSSQRDIRPMKPNLRPDRRFFGKPSGGISGIVCMVLGIGLCGIASYLTFISLIMSLFGGESFAAVFGFGIFFVVGLALTGRGVALKERAGRFKRYVSIAQQKLYCSIEELAGKTGHNKKFVLKDIKRMIRKGWFLQAHLDKQESCLIVSDEMYEQYRLTQNNYEQQEERKRQEEQQAKERQTERQAQTKPGAARAETARNSRAEDTDRNRTEYEKMLEEGQNYVRMIRRCNDEIPGEEMSEKLDKLELLVTRIFDQVEKQPELAPDMHKMLNYYLPTTQKLLEAYRDLDKQNLELQNISKTKKEIEDTVDTINQAFEKFLDELFREKAWDIQSDISVLHTMLKQDGYLKGDFEQK